MKKIRTLIVDDEPLARERLAGLLSNEADIEVVDFPVQGQQTTDYAEFRRIMSSTLPESVAYLGVMLFGTRKKVGRIVGKYSLLRQP